MDLDDEALNVSTADEARGQKQDNSNGSEASTVALEVRKNSVTALILL